MRRAPLLALAATAVLVAGVGLAVARHDTGRPRTSPTPGAAEQPSQSPTATLSTTPSASHSTPTPVGNTPRDQQYDVVYAAGTSMDDGELAVAQAGGVVIHANAKVGVVTVSAGRDFVGRARKQNAVFGAVRNRAIGLPPAPEPSKEPAPGGGVTRTNQAADPLADLQWDLDVIHAPQAATKGDKRVLVAVIDTGVDGTHPDLRAAYDQDLSRNFVTDYPGADGACERPDCHDPVNVDESGHGTHVAGTIAAAAGDGFGMRGIAPGVRLVGLRAGQDSGLFLLMPTVDALVYAGDIGVDVANLSYFVDPWLFNCPSAPQDSSDDSYEQRALIEGVRRAVDYAYGHGVTLVAAAGNEHTDLDHVTTDTASPDFPEDAARPRTVDANKCYVLPTTLPHVIEVSSVARDGIKADYSDYGLHHITVTAPGGSGSLANGAGPDPRYGTLSTWPANVAKEEGAVGRDGTPRTPYVVRYCRAKTCAYYRYLTGTSMAAPHVTAVAALIVSTYGTPDPAHPGQLRMDPAKVVARLAGTATPRPCPSPARQDYPSRGPTFSATCTGTKEHNAFYGDGLVDAQRAVA